MRNVKFVSGKLGIFSMNGLMQNVPLTLNLIRERVADLYLSKRVTTHFSTGFHQTTYGEVLARSSKLASFLSKAGVRHGDRVATLAWNSHRHLELYLAIPCMGAVLHTLNVRLSIPDISKLLDHASDSVLFVDRSVWSGIKAEVILPKSLKCVVVCEDEAETDTDAIDSRVTVLKYEDAIADFQPLYDWPHLDELSAAGLCYTSGTTGDPKGVLYSHRSTVLHTFSCLFADGIAMRESDVCMPVVPMFHANAWGFPYAAMLAGASLALPCRNTDPDTLFELIDDAKVTLATAVPTVWLKVLEALKSNAAVREKLTTLRRLPIGGAAVNKALIDGFAEFGIEVMHCWGMTEISPLGLTNFTRSDIDPADDAKRKTAQGIAIPGCRARIVDDQGLRCIADGKTSGELQVSSPWAASSYFNGKDDEGSRPTSSFTFSEGREWLRTGDVATIDRYGYVSIVDRTKDLIKSGGEWISSQALESQLLNHPDVLEAAVVARLDATWQERPVACVSLREPAPEVERRFVLEMPSYLARYFAKWQIPKEVEFFGELPKGKTGKIDKHELRIRINSAVKGLPAIDM